MKPWSIVPPLLASLVAAAPAAAVPVTFDIKKGGDVAWTSAPCTADLYASGAADPDKTGVDVSAPIEVEAGAWEAVVACASDEGVVKRSAAFTVKKDELKVPLALEPGFLLVTVLRFDTPARAEITIFDERGREVAASKDKAVIPLCPGKVKVLAKVDDAKAGRAVFGNTQATIVTKQKASATVDTTDGSLLVTLTDNGRKAGGVVALRQPGLKTRLVELHAGEKGDAPAGTYDLVTQLDDTHDFSEVVTHGVTILPGKLTQRAVGHSTAAVKPLVLVDGHAPPADAKIDVELSSPGATAPFNTAALGDALKVAGGTFELAAVRKDQTRDDGTPPRATAKITVHGGESRSVTLDITSAHLDVVTLVGGKPKALDVEIGAPGNAVALARKTADADGKVSFALSSGKYTVKAILKAPQGDIVTTHDLSLALGSRIATRLNVDVGTAVVQVFEGGVAVPAEVRFFPSAQMKAGKPTGDPVVSVPSGQEAQVPPGSYALVVIRKGNEFIFSDLKVASGRTVERTVEVK